MIELETKYIEKFMNIAIEEAVLSMNDHLETGIPKIFIGAVLVNNDNEILGKAHKIEEGSKRIHSEYQLLINLPKKGNPNLTLFTTLEPCNFRHGSNDDQPTCTDLIIDKGIGSVVVAMLDPHPKINGKAVKRLTEVGINVNVLENKSEYKHLINKLAEMNSEFINFKW
jgi:diaminohydroxyphosphoribosylaminopyrimidine deaminase/5-amino-6-(5-phosphoribosylamino)uracil reductase